MAFVKLDRQNNMGLVRYFLALAVVVHHFNGIFGTSYFWPISGYHAVGGFFALSGFLIYGSYMRSSSLKVYFEKRARKILPPYLFIVLSCALLLYFTVEPAMRADYFSWQWVRYVVSNVTFLNFLGNELPGVFTGNPIHAVNGSLWTMKVEWLLYASLPLFVWLTLCTGWNKSWTAAVVFVLSCSYRLWFHHLYDVTGSETCIILSHQVFGQLSSFYAGIIIYLNYERFMRWRWIIAALCGAAACAGTAIPYYAYYLEPAVISCLVVWFSMVGKWGVWAGNNDNVSYEMYLFHWPILQLVWQYRHTLGVDDFGALVMSLVLTGALACGCWFGFGRRILRGPSAKK